MSQPVDTSEILHELNQKVELKQYVAGNTYNGVALTVTGVNFTLTHGAFYPARTIATSLGGDEGFKVDFVVRGTVSAGVNNFALTYAGITTIADYQAICTYDQDGGVYCKRSYMNPGGNTSLNTFSGTGWTKIVQFGVIRLSTKPTWMD